MACATAFLEGLAATDRRSGAAPVPLQAIAAAVVDRFPALKGVYNAWWTKEKESPESAYVEATKKESFSMAQAHLCAGAPFMLATHLRNLDKDCSESCATPPSTATSCV
jgi:hypothetical protein